VKDRLTKEHRSWNMSRIRGKNTTPELRVRSLLHRLGYRFRLHVKSLPGKPDIVLPKYKTVIFVQGCRKQSRYLGSSNLPARTTIMTERTEKPSQLLLANRRYT
jgi:DNA mismatch endonuclease Vsr